MEIEKLRFIAITVPILYSIAGIDSSAGPGDGVTLLPPPHGGARTALFFPLFLSAPNASRSNSSESLLRRLSGSHSRPNARMRLYDDLLHNGYYSTRLWIGTPPQKFALIVDTGSTVTYVPCSPCIQCGKHQDPRFDPSLSRTYQPMKCNVDCNCDDEMMQCIYERQYAELSTSSGILGSDIMSFGNLSSLKPQRAVFGCEELETGELYTQHADGIMGLGRGGLSVVDQLVEKGVINDSFSLCYGGMGVGGGAMVLGGISPPSGMVFTGSDPTRSPYYNIELKEMHVAGKPLPLKPKVFNGKHGTVVDSGTTYAYLPEAVFLLFKDAIIKELHSLKKIPGPDPKYDDICFSGGGSDISKLSKTFPAVDMVFHNRQKLVLSPENYLFRHSKVKNAYCLGIFQNGKDPTTLLGGIIFRNTLVMYDREQKRVGFLKTNCSNLWEKLHMPAEPPLGPPAATEYNFSTEVSPSMSPIDSPHYNFPGEVEVGQIIFDMSISTNYSNLKLHIAELVGFIAGELNVTTSQVRLSNFSSKGNESLIRWIIVPAASADHISNENAVNIISRISEHRLQLPDDFGTYKIVHWNVQPSRTRTWWEHHHYLAVMMTVMGTLVIGASAVGGVWYICRQKQRTLNPYHPFAPASEQELAGLNI